MLTHFLTYVANGILNYINALAFSRAFTEIFIKKYGFQSVKYVIFYVYLSTVSIADVYGSPECI